MVNPSENWDLESVPKTALSVGGTASYVSFRSKLQPNYFRVWSEIASGWAILLFTVGVLVNAPQSIAAALLGAVAMGLMISYLHLFLHEAAHYGLARSAIVSDRLANVFLAPLLLCCVEFYRFVHFAHHRSLATEGDTENSYFRPLNLRFIISALCGQRVMEVLFQRSQNQVVKVPQSVQKKNRRFFLVGALSHGVGCLALVLTGYPFVSVAWVLGVVTFTPFFGAVRQLLEHRATGLGDQDLRVQPAARFSGVFKVGPWARVFGAAGFNRHAIHHWDPTLSYTCFEAVESFLLKTDLGDSYRAARKSYWQAFGELYRDGKQKRNVSAPLLKLRQLGS